MPVRACKQQPGISTASCRRLGKSTSCDPGKRRASCLSVDPLYGPAWATLRGCCMYFSLIIATVRTKTKVSERLHRVSVESGSLVIPTVSAAFDILGLCRTIGNCSSFSLKNTFLSGFPIYHTDVCGYLIVTPVLHTHTHTLHLAPYLPTQSFTGQPHFLSLSTVCPPPNPAHPTLCTFG